MKTCDICGKDIAGTDSVTVSFSSMETPRRRVQLYHYICSECSEMVLGYMKEQHDWNMKYRGSSDAFTPSPKTGARANSDDLN